LVSSTGSLAKYLISSDLPQLQPLLPPQDNKRKAEGEDKGSRKILSDVGNAPSGPRTMGQEGRNLADRLGGRPARGGRQFRGMAGGRQPGGPGRGMNGREMGMGMGMGMDMGQMGEFKFERVRKWRSERCIG
jgi:hypothetical protein